MELSVQDKHTKQLIKAALIEMLVEHKDIMVKIVREAMEDYALGQAIEEGIEDDLVSREDIFKILSPKGLL